MTVPGNISPIISVPHTINATPVWVFQLRVCRHGKGAKDIFSTIRHHADKAKRPEMLTFNLPGLNLRKNRFRCFGHISVARNILVRSWTTVYSANELLSIGAVGSGTLIDLLRHLPAAKAAHTTAAFLQVAT